MRGLYLICAIGVSALHISSAAPQNGRPERCQEFGVTVTSDEFNYAAHKLRQSVKPDDLTNVTKCYIYTIYSYEFIAAQHYLPTPAEKAEGRQKFIKFFDCLGSLYDPSAPQPAVDVSKSRIAQQLENAEETRGIIDQCKNWKLPNLFIVAGTQN